MFSAKIGKSYFEIYIIYQDTFQIILLFPADFFSWSLLDFLGEHDRGRGEGNGSFIFIFPMFIATIYYSCIITFVRPSKVMLDSNGIASTPVKFLILTEFFQYFTI